MKRSVANFLAFAVMLLFSSAASAQTPAGGEQAAKTAPEPSTAVPAPAQSPGPDPSQTRRALIICGLPGDSEHRKLFSEAIETLYSALTGRYGFAAERVAVLFGDEATGDDGPALRSSRGPATREILTEAVAELGNSLQLDDALWVFVLGHAHFDGRMSWLNLPGPDMDQTEFGKLFAALKCREQAFFITTAASGYFVKPLSMPGRIVVTATEADFEVNETVFPHKLAKLLANPPALAEFDIDGDGRATLADIYLLAARDTAQDYASGEMLATEHSLLDDNGDGRGTELQADYLPEELGGRYRPSRAKPTQRAGDGAVARSILIPVPLATDGDSETSSEAAPADQIDGNAPASNFN